jgi:hypothetical protein
MTGRSDAEAKIGGQLNCMSRPTIAILGVTALIVMMHMYDMPRFRRCVQVLKTTDAATLAAIGSPDGTMFGSRIVPLWGFRMVKYVWCKHYEKVGNEDLKLAGAAFRPAMITAQIGILSWIVLSVLFGRGSS